MEQVRIDFVPGGVTPNAHASQYDIGRVIRFKLYNSGSPYTLIGTETITVKMTKPDGTEETISLTNTSSDYVDFTTTDGLLNQAGIYPCEISLTAGGDIIGSQNFNLKAEADAYGNANIVILSIGPLPICTFDTTLAEPYQSITVNVLATGGNGEPDNPNPINGYTEANITRCGVNLLSNNDSELPKTSNGVSFSQEADGSYTIVASAEKTGYPFARIGKIYLPQGTYSISTSTGISGISFRAVDRTVSPPEVYTNTFTLSENKPELSIEIAVTANDVNVGSYNIEGMLNVGSPLLPYTPYNGQTYTIAFGQTVYGGVLDVTSGKLTVTWAGTKIKDLGWYYDSGFQRFYATEAVDIKHPPTQSVPPYIKCDIYTPVGFDRFNASPLPNNAISNPNANGRINIRDTRYTDTASFIAGVGEYYLAYELATPFDIDLTPVQIRALMENNVFADCGETEVEYLAEGT